MNEYLFYLLIVPWIAYEHLPISLNRRSSEKTGLKKLYKIPAIYSLYLDIYIHTGYPCFRYCICKYFTFKDKQNSVIQRWYN